MTFLHSPPTKGLTVSPKPLIWTIKSETARRRSQVRIGKVASVVFALIIVRHAWRHPTEPKGTA